MSAEYRNNFTKFIDKYRINKIMELEDWYRDMMSTYLCYSDIENDNYENGVKHIAFRLPGATRGHITVDKDYIIQDIVFYKETCFGYKQNELNAYRPEVVVDVTKKFRGTKLDIENGELED